MLPSSDSNSPIHRKWSSSDSRSISQFISNSFSSLSTSKRNSSVKNSNCCMEQNENGAMMIPYEQKPGLMPFPMSPPSLWYPAAPPPLTIPFCVVSPTSISHPQYPLPAASQTVKRIKRKKPDSACSQICCGGVAQLLWTIVVIVIMGMVSALILALIVI